ncbi:hypothetical protein QCA50_009722 [Cerrena zonata]|uniref:Uncharacterized protein n=1 Tax=Cerrena zonata TaxID=2478898 RepID=A0AAW0G4A8_9APHY
MVDSAVDRGIGCYATNRPLYSKSRSALILRNVRTTFSPVKTYGLKRPGEYIDYRVVDVARVSNKMEQMGPRSVTSLVLVVVYRTLYEKGNSVQPPSVCLHLLIIVNEISFRVLILSPSFLTPSLFGLLDMI